MFINVEETPNPNTLKFIPEKDMSVDRSCLFKKTDDLKSNDFLKNLFDIDGVESILIDSGFISVTKDNSSSWAVLRTILTSKIGVFLEKNNYVIYLTLNYENVSDNKKHFNDIEKYKKEQSLLDPELRYENNILKTLIKMEKENLIRSKRFKINKNN